MAAAAMAPPGGTAGPPSMQKRHSISQDSNDSAPGSSASSVVNLPPTHSRLPPDGHEFPPDYKDPSSGLTGQVRVVCRLVLLIVYRTNSNYTK